MTSTITNHRDVVVVGGGQAGLAIGYHLAQQGTDFTILEAAAEPAAAWRERWDSLKLFTSARYDSLPGMEFPGDPDRYPTRDEVADYLTDYAREFELPVELNSRVRAVRRQNDGYRRGARRPCLRGAAGGDRHRPVPGAIRAADRGRTSTTTSCRCTARAIARRSPYRTAACSSSAAATPAFRSRRSCRPPARCIWPIGSRQTPLPQRMLGRDLFWYLDATGLIRKIDGFPNRQADAEAGGHADRVESASRTSARHRAPRPSRRCGGIDRQLR